MATLESLNNRFQQGVTANELPTQGLMQGNSGIGDERLRIVGGEQLNSHKRRLFALDQTQFFQALAEEVEQFLAIDWSREHNAILPAIDHKGVGRLDQVRDLLLGPTSLQSSALEEVVGLRQIIHNSGSSPTRSAYGWMLLTWNPSPGVFQT